MIQQIIYNHLANSLMLLCNHNKHDTTLPYFNQKEEKKFNYYFLDLNNFLRKKIIFSKAIFKEFVELTEKKMFF